jgi:hypothetical protein
MRQNPDGCRLRAIGPAPGIRRGPSAPERRAGLSICSGRSAYFIASLGPCLPGQGNGRLLTCSERSPPK